MTFIEFNQIVNPNDTMCYIAYIPGKAKEVCKFDRIRDLSRSEPALEIFWIPSEEFIAITTRQLMVAATIQIKTNDIFAYKNDESLFIVAQSTFKRNTINNMLACGISANTLYGKKSEVPLPFRNKKINTSKTLDKFEILTTGNKIRDLPLWLTPIRRVSNIMPDGIEVPIIGNTQTVLRNLCTRLKTLDKFQTQEVIQFVNQEFCTAPCTADEMNNLLHIVESDHNAQFFNKDTFLHYKMGDYIVEHCHVIRDEQDGDLYFYDKAKQIYSNDQQYLFGYMTRLCPQLKQYQKEETINYVNNYLYDESKRLNSDPLTVVFRNGILNVADMVLRPMSPDHYESIRINANYDPDAYSETVDEFFDTATSHDLSLEKLLYEAMGYSMLKTAELQKGFILTGNGRNGKSTYLDIIKAVLGKQNTTAVSFKDLANNFRASQLKGKLASLAGDVSAQPLSDSDLVKSITSGEDITIEQKYKNAHQEALFATLFFACNKLPRTPDTSDGFYRRWAIIPFNADLSKVSAVDGMKFKQKILKQEAIDYVAFRAINAIRVVLDTTKKFTEPKAVIDMLEKYKIDNSAVLSFIRDEFAGDTRQVEKYTLRGAYNKYTAWAQKTNRGTMSLVAFKNAIKSDAKLDLSETI